MTKCVLCGKGWAFKVWRVVEEPKAGFDWMCKKCQKRLENSAPEPHIHFGNRRIRYDEDDELQEDTAKW